MLFELPPDLPEKSAATIAIHKAYLNKLAMNGISTVADLKKNKRHIMDMIDALSEMESVHQKKKKMRSFLSAIFWVLGKNKFYYKEYLKVKDSYSGADSDSN
jgi:hypothetical protein